VGTSVIDSLGEDLLLLSIRPDKGDLASGWIDYGLSASELVRLAARGRIDIQADHVVVRDATPVGDAELDAALDSLVQAKQPPKAKHWIVGGWTYKGRRVVTAYLGRLVSAGALRSEKRRITGTRWLITDPARVANARERLDAIALSPGQVDVAQAAFGGLAYAIGLAVILYPGKANRSVWQRLQQVAEGQWTIEAVTGAAADAASGDPAGAMTQGTTRAVVQAATGAVIQAVRDKRAAQASSG
jgi:hypothetical protein